MAEYRRQRDWIQGHFNRLTRSEARYNHDNASDVNEARCISTLRDIDRFNYLAGVGYGCIVAALLMRKFRVAEAVPVYAVGGWIGAEVNRFRHHDVMYAGLLRVVTKDPEHPV